MHVPDPLANAVRLHEALTAAYLEHNGILPLTRNAGELVVGCWGEVSEEALDDLRLLFGAEPRLVLHPEEELRAAIRRAYAASGASAADVIAGIGSAAGGNDAMREAGEASLDDLRAMANDEPVVRLVGALLREALEARASDVHLEGHAGGLRVRYRIDGVLQDAPAPPSHLKAAVVSRLKIMAELDIAERRLPQDGRIRLRLDGRDIDVRVSTLPILEGESVVLRLLDKQRGRISLAELGMAADTLEAFSRAIARPNGIVLATGPTGSGKTTTLYAALEHMRTGREKILTVEDPVEYELPGVCQVPVNNRTGLTFPTALRAFLRQDPDIVLVGEIRDRGTAEIATHAALTGHLVLSTLHTNDAPGAVARLLDLGVEDYLAAGVLEAVR